MRSSHNPFLWGAASNGAGGDRSFLLNCTDPPEESRDAASSLESKELVRFGRGAQPEGTVEGCSLLGHPRAAVLGKSTGFGLSPDSRLGHGGGRAAAGGLVDP